jgi:C-type mannose receptor
VGDTTLSWQDARDFCQAWGGDLVEIGSAEENAELTERIDGAAWIGASDQAEEGTFVWPGGNSLDYEAWFEGQPNNLQGLEDCVELRAIDGQWADTPCMGNVSRQALCERTP